MPRRRALTEAQLEGFLALPAAEPDLVRRRREILSWLLPVALATTSATSIASALMDELRRRRLIVPGPFIIERLVATATARRCELGEPERLAHGIELLVAGLEARGVGAEHPWLGADLVGHEAERLGRDRLARPQQPPGIAQRTELQGVAEPVAVASASTGSGEVDRSAAERPAGG